MSKPKKSRQHKCKTSLGHPSKYENIFVCQTCRHKTRGSYSFTCTKCGGILVQVNKN